MSDESTISEAQAVPTLPVPPRQDRLIEIARLFTRLGFTAFGGPAAHIAMFRDEVVTRRKWITDQHFLDLLGAVNLIPGPNSTEMAIHIGFVRGGWRGMLIAGFCFISPAVLIVLIFAMLYVSYGTTPAAQWLLYGIKPVVIAIIANAVYGLLGSAVKNRFLGGVGVAALALYLLGINELLLLFGLGLLVMLVVNIQRLRSSGAASMLVPLLPFAAQTMTTPNVPVTLELLFLSFLKIGGLLYGGGYVLLAFLRTDFVEWLGWLSNQQLLDAVAVGQFTPGPLFTTATFIGYILAGLPGALLATLGIFLPSFIFVYITNPFIPRMRQSKWFSALLDGVNVAALGLMAGVTVDLAREALIEPLPLTAGLALISGVLVIRYKVNTTWLILGGAAVGIGYALLTNQPLA